MSDTAPPIHGHVAAGFESVRDAFARNFSERRELGAACAVVYRGELVVDLWGGYRDAQRQAPWQRDTMVGVFSTTKGMASIAMAHAHARGLLDYDAAVATYWPEFAQNGKDGVTVRQLLSHQAGLCAIDAPLDLAKLADPDAVAIAIARQEPAWEPGARHGYHALTLGWYESELLRRVDPQRRTIGRYFHDEIAAPHGLAFYIGLPDDIPAERVAWLKGYKPWRMLLHLNKLPRAFVLNMFRPNALAARALGNPPELGDTTRYNDRAIQRIEIPAANGIGEARAIARAYGALAQGGAALGLSADTMAALTEPATLPRAGALDAVLRMNTSFGLGYLKPSADIYFGSSRRAFGTPGAGGSFGFADPDIELGFAYAPNRLGYHLPFDPRDVALREAVYAAIGVAPFRG